MSGNASRRTFLQSTTAGGLAAFASQLGFLKQLPRVSAAEAALPAGIVQFNEQIEPLVRLLEETPRQQVLERVAEKIHAGASYQEVLAALFLAGIRNVQPRPSVGFKFHSVLCVNSCHLASLAGPDDDRWLPIFWAIDYFKSAQADEARSSGWRMSALDDSRIPSAEAAEEEFIQAMDRWDVERADRATAALVRTADQPKVFHLFARYAARDFRDLGHKAIFLANGWRTLDVIGWQFAEPVLRSLSFAMLNHRGDANPSESDLAPDRPWRENEELVRTSNPEWGTGKVDDTVAKEIIGGVRSANVPEELSRMIAKAGNNGVSTQSLWDGIFVGSGELLMQQPGIVALHAMTTANAVHAIWSRVEDSALRQRLLLQAGAFNVFFRQAAIGRGDLNRKTIDDLAPQPPSATGAGAIDNILHEISSDRMQAAKQVLGYLNAGGDPYALIDASRTVLFLKGTNSHDYKFSSAVLEDFDHVSPAWRNRYLALSVFNLRGAGDRDNALVERTRAALD